MTTDDTSTDKERTVAKPATFMWFPDSVDCFERDSDGYCANTGHYSESKVVNLDWLLMERNRKISIPKILPLCVFLSVQST
jgi:hypothetical protein